jgi:hypothetical protein
MSMEVKKVKYDIIVMMILMIVCVLFYFIFIPGQIRLSGAWNGNTSFSSRTFPYISVITIFIVSSISLIKSIVTIKKHKSEISLEAKAKYTFNKKTIYHFFMPFIVYLIILAYGILFMKIGYIFATLIVPPILLFVLGCKRWQIYSYVYGFAAIMYLIFKIVLKVPMP